MANELLRGLRADLHKALQKVDALLAEAETKGEPGDMALKQSNGRLTEAGVARLRTMLGADCGVAEIARALGVSQTAVIQHRRKYEAERPARKRR